MSYTRILLRHEITNLLSFNRYIVWEAYTDSFEKSNFFLYFRKVLSVQNIVLSKFKLSTELQGRIRRKFRRENWYPETSLTFFLKLCFSTRSLRYFSNDTSDSFQISKQYSAWCILRRIIFSASQLFNSLKTFKADFSFQ